MKVLSALLVCAVALKMREEPEDMDPQKMMNQKMEDALKMMVSQRCQVLMKKCGNSESDECKDEACKKEAEAAMKKAMKMVIPQLAEKMPELGLDKLNDVKFFDMENVKAEETPEAPEAPAAHEEAHEEDAEEDEDEQDKQLVLKAINKVHKDKKIEETKEESEDEDEQEEQDDSKPKVVVASDEENETLNSFIQIVSPDCACVGNVKIHSTSPDCACVGKMPEPVAKAMAQLKKDPDCACSGKTQTPDCACAGKTVTMNQQKVKKQDPDCACSGKKQDPDCACSGKSTKVAKKQDPDCACSGKNQDPDCGCGGKKPVVQLNKKQDPDCGCSGREGCTCDKEKRK